MKNIIFDLDGTLLYSLGDLHTSTNYALKACGYPQRTLEEVRQFVGNGVALLIRRAAPQGISEEAFQECFNVFKEHYAVHCLDTTRPYEGIMPLLESLKARGIKTAIVSNKLQQAVSELNDRFFKGLIHVAIGETLDVERKPAPDMVLKAMAALHADKANTIYVGDSDVDILTAKNAGLPCISVLWGFRSRPFLLEHGASTLISSPSEILPLVEEMK